MATLAALEEVVVGLAAETVDRHWLAERQLHRRVTEAVQGLLPTMLVLAVLGAVLAASEHLRRQASQQTEARVSVAQSQALALAVLAAVLAA